MGKFYPYFLKPYLVITCFWDLGRSGGNNRHHFSLLSPRLLIGQFFSTALPAAAAYTAVQNYIQGQKRPTRPTYYTPTSQTMNYTRNGSKRYKRGNTLTQAIRNNASPMHLAIGDGVNAVELKHNKVQTQNLLNFLVQGDTQYNRTGDNVYLETIKINATWEGPSVSSNGTTLRMMIVMHDDFFASNYITATGLLIGDLNMTGTGIARTPSMITDPKKCTVLDDRTFTLNQSLAGVSEKCDIVYNVPLKRSFVFQPGTQEGKDRNLYLVVVADISGGINDTTVCGQLYINQDLIYKVTK